MSRSLHTRPRRIRAADRLRRPHAPRRARDLAGARRALRELKRRGLVGQPAEDRKGAGWKLPRIVETPPRAGFHHPASIAEITEVLRFFGEESVYGIRHIELRQGPSRAGGPMCFGRLVVPGRIYLFDQPPSPWRLPGRLAEEDAERLASAGARIEADDDVSQVHWTPESLRDFVRLDVLMHEIGHHLLQHFKGKRTQRIARTIDHESFAETFASSCREAYREAHWEADGP